MKKTVVGALIVVAGLATFASFASQGKPGVKNINPVDPVKHEAMQIALENKDYDARKELMDGKGMVNQITTEEQFLKFIEMKDAFDAGDIETAQKLQEELGMPQKGMMGARKGMGQGMMNTEQHEAIQAAIEAGDYDTWKELSANTPMAEKIDTKEKFKKLTEMHGYMGKAREIREELGLEMGRKGQGKFGNGMGQ